MQNKSVSILEAARTLKKDKSTIQKWIQRGAPCVEPGEVGRGRGALVSVSDLLKWRAGTITPLDDREAKIKGFAVTLWDVFQRDGASNRIGITEKETAGILILVFDRFHKNLLHESPPELKKLPEEIRKLFHILLD